MSWNPYKQLLDALPRDAEAVGTVTDADPATGLLTVQLIGGGTLTARGTADLGDTVHLRGPVITGTVTAPAGVSEEI